MKTVNKLAFLLFLLIAPALFSFAPIASGDQIIGVWLTSKGKAKIQIYRNGDEYFGKIISGADLYEANGTTLKKDLKNDDHAKRGRTIKDLVLLNGFRYSDGTWSEGTIYDPQNGSTYSCKMKLKGSALEIRGYIGISLFGRTEVWKKVQG